MAKILVAMSGGVDSSYTAAKLKKDGNEVIGATLDFKLACSPLAISDTKKIANILNIEHHTLDSGNDFNNKIISYFKESYYNGLTPNPCAKCNREIKFAILLKYMEEIGADFLATGHYANIENSVLSKAIDLKKDQSYFLSMLKYEYLKNIIFPLGKFTKTQVREASKEFNLPVAEKKDSQDICFIENNNYRKLLENTEKGEIRHINGEILGEHNGIINYTLGQRKGLGIGYKSPLFVVKIDPKENIVYVSDNENDLFSDKITLSEVNLLDKNIKFNEKYILNAKLRSTHTGEDAEVIFSENNAEIKMLKPTRAITPGQLCTIYKDNQVIAGGWININLVK